MGDTAAAPETVVPIEAPQTQKALAVPPALAAEIIEILSSELPMKRVRNAVTLLEQCPLLEVNVS